MIKRFRTLIATAMTVGTVSALAIGSIDDWPQWRGPDRTGVSAESHWSSQGADQALWERSVGLGYSSVVVSGDRLYTTGWTEEGDQDRVVCLNAQTGEEVWSHAYGAKRWAKFHGGGTNSTPSIDGDRLWVLNREGRLTCLDRHTGDVKWTKTLVDQPDALPTWGLAASPLILDDMAVVNAGIVRAYDKSTGAEVWSSRNLGHAYSTPVDFDVDEKGYLAVINGGGLFILDRADGSTVANQAWKTKYDVNAATPIVMDGGKIFISSGYGRGCGLFAFDGDTLKEIWTSKVMRTKMSGCLLVNGYLYGFDESILKCVDPDGKEQWSQRGLGTGALSAAGNRLIIMSSRGELLIAAATPERFDVLSRAKVLDGGVYWTMPVLSDGVIYCRNSKGALTARNHRGE